MSIHAQVTNFINHPQPDRFEDLALAVFAHQFDQIGPYRKFCLDCGASPAGVRAVTEVPVVSTAAFKYVAFCNGDPERIFLTSGTTRGPDQRGRHFVADLEHYRASAISHLRRMLFPDRRRTWMLALHPTAERMPESSLSQMISWCIESFGTGRSLCCATPQRVETDAALGFLRAAVSAGEAICILGTTAALSTLFEYLEATGARLELAPGSRLMDTGGAKGQAKPLAPEEVVAMAQRYLRIAPPMVINEYGMTELSSQLYDATAFNSPGLLAAEGRVKVAPPWLKVMARDPVTLLPLKAGQTGLLSFFDLANAGSVSALLTEDLGSVAADGTVRIFGRVLASDPRGCALGIEQFAQPDLGTAKPLSMALPRDQTWGAQTGDRTVQAIVKIAADLRGLAARRVDPRRVAEALARACARWRDPDFSGRIGTLVRVAAATGQSEALLGASLDALLARFTPQSLNDLARELRARDGVIGVILPGNVMGAGLHELVQALIGGAGLIVKAASEEPLFFVEFRRTLAAIDAEVAARIQVLVWNRLDREATVALARVCDRVAAFGDDETMAAVAAIAGPKLIDFGSRLSGALLSHEAICGPHAQSNAAALARDVALYDQRGCLSLHHVFIETSSVREAQVFAGILAREMAALARSMATPAIAPIADTVAARAVRENARWRALGGAPVALWEGDGLGWTVILDPEADFEASPRCRTVRVSVVASHDELAQRLGPAAGRLEGFAIADPAGRLGRSRALLGSLGVSYFCPPGRLQSPPPSWPHGGGRFLNLMVPGDG